MRKLTNCLLILCVFLCIMAPDALGVAYSGAVTNAQKGFRNFLSISSDNPYLPVIALLGCLLTIASFYFPRFGLMIMLLFIMVATDMPVGKKDVVRATTIRIEDMILVLVSAGWIFNRAKTRTLSTIRECMLYKPIFLMALVIVLATIFGFFQGTVDYYKGILYSIKRLEYFWIFFMTYNLMDFRKDGLFAMRLFIFVSGIVAFIGIIQYFLFPLSELSVGGSTATAGFGRANTISDFYLIMLGVLTGLFIQNTDRKWMFIYLGAVIVFILAIIMTKSRGAYVSIPPLFLIIILISKSSRLLLLFFSILIIALVYTLGTSFVGGQMTEMLITRHENDIKDQFSSIGKVMENGASADSSLNSRYTACVNEFPEMMKCPILGHGVGSIPLFYFDNQFAIELYDTGFLGLSAFFYLNFMIFISVYMTYRNSGHEFTKGLSLGFMGSQVGMLVHGLTVTNFYTIINMEAFWFILAVIMLLTHVEKQEKYLNPKFEGK